jgi:hypothetical protein
MVWRGGGVVSKIVNPNHWVSARVPLIVPPPTHPTPYTPPHPPIFYFEVT